MTVDDKWIGLALAISSSLAIGLSSIITKKGLNAAASESEGAYGAAASDNLSYLKNGVCRLFNRLTLLPVANFAAYSFAPPILVTPLGALSVLVGAILASFLLQEELGHLGRVGCGLSLIGSLIIVLHAPEDKDVSTVDEILSLAVSFLLYVFTVLVFSMIMIYVVSPRYGKSNPLVYISICSVVGSVSVMSIKGFGIAVKLTFGNNNQFTRPSTYVFAIVSAFCILVQMNYFNKALDTVNPMYYVGFSTATIVASLILFQGFNTTDTTNTVSLLCGFVVTFLGVHILNLSRRSAKDGHGDVNDHRTSLTGRLSLDGWHGIVDGGRPEGGPPRMTHGRRSSLYRSQTQVDPRKSRSHSNSPHPPRTPSRQSESQVDLRFPPNPSLRQ
ncbi:magnesium transporter NIPA-domain-containing protein [Rhodocollybia butyracea]|uniref:Magnesium transporter NIPA-domain-containing protein n=1 Tax=Rhodocollybia butyracea TaxID=206335 RepID=A0A9P5PPH1_9AGAR|nr:magnesium transporter NIPA-domain-containing protein [Rhodocollybia butyracea]